LKRLLVCTLLGWAALAAAQPKSDWERAQEEREWKETEHKLPAPPTGKDLIEFQVNAASSFKFFIDPPSLSVGGDGVVRYTMIARSAAGAETVTHEGIRCASETYRVYAFANNGVWSRGNTEWRPIEPMGVQHRWHNVLRSQYFCPQRISIGSAEEGLNALRRGGHPALRKTSY